MMKETSYELIKDNKKKQFGKHNEAKMTLYNALPRKEYERVFMCKITKDIWHTLIITHHGNSQVKNFKIDLLTQEREKFLISNEETIDSGFTRLNSIVTSFKSLDPDYSSKNHVRNDEDKDEKEKFNSIVRNLWKLFKKGNRLERENCRGGRSKGVGSSR
uniref:Zf-CCHC domain-containing protein/DUF4219 domain-containing protein/UBN2 domain-containing protein n=1 Tax=Tanacetum cinerariifolium TaxID=118510 RepID=A0A699H2G3_TANCI|nr:zf-CCHC domain-containing protein/DUF4219 domain-containing protein/UBN2 domain-containing protein [Tanacetum cinerariifolium]